MKSQIENEFSYHTPSEDQISKYQQLRDMGKELAILIEELVPDCPDKTASIRKLRECIMTANSGIACNTFKIISFD